MPNAWSIDVQIHFTICTQSHIVEAYLQGPCCDIAKCRTNDAWGKCDHERLSVWMRVGSVMIMYY